MSIKMHIQCADEYRFISLLKIKVIKIYLAENYLDVDGYIPIILCDEWYHALTRICSINQKFATYQSLDMLLDIMKKYANYEIVSPTQYDSSSGIVTIKGGYEVDLI